MSNDIKTHVNRGRAQVKRLSGWSRSYALAKYHWRSLRHNNFSLPSTIFVFVMLSQGNWIKIGLN